jgi:hypothetical protein
MSPAERRDIDAAPRSYLLPAKRREEESWLSVGSRQVFPQVNALANHPLGIDHRCLLPEEGRVKRIGYANQQTRHDNNAEEPIIGRLRRRLWEAACGHGFNLERAKTRWIVPKAAVEAILRGVLTKALKGDVRATKFLIEQKEKHPKPAEREPVTLVLTYGGPDPKTVELK